MKDITRTDFLSKKIEQKSSSFFRGMYPVTALPRQGSGLRELAPRRRRRPSSSSAIMELGMLLRWKKRWKHDNYLSSKTQR
jgi:hypothetical protein